MEHHHDVPAYIWLFNKSVNLNYLIGALNLKLITEHSYHKKEPLKGALVCEHSKCLSSDKNIEIMIASAALCINVNVIISGF